MFIKDVSKACPCKTTIISVSSVVTSNAGALRAGLVARAEDWRWASLWRPVQKIEPAPKLLSPWPIARLPNWVARVNEPLSEQELDAVRRCVRRGSPLGDASWFETTARRLGLESTLRPRGRPRVRPAQKTQNNESCRLFFFFFLSRLHAHGNSIEMAPPGLAPKTPVAWRDLI